MGKNIQQITDDTLAKGGVLAHFYFDAHGKDPEEVKAKMVNFIERMTEDPNAVYAVGEIQPPVENEGLFSTHAEVKILTKNYQNLLALAIHYGPLSVEIIKPNEIRLNLEDAQNIAVDIAVASYQFSSFILNKTMTEQERKEFEKVSKTRAEIGQKINESKHHGVKK